ncbi:hypothetical protein ABZX30_36410 [Streptomyces sp. NPDC004542]|uniref:hypothetical protein n=1 Tax=Streptomyces sp. NPDC004542 TaxID=3154281 RepID=UPI0033B979AF
MADYSQGGFHEDGSGIYADPTVQGSPSDYDSWDWKQIMAAITGGSALVPGEGGEARASSVSSPQTLVKAANDFQYVQEVMAMVAKSLADQSKALAGGEGAPWRGGAADAFMESMTTFSKQVASNAEALGGGATGSSVGQNLVWSANALAVAQANIHAIDYWYANQAARLGVKPMANGLMPISQKPELVQMMTDDMRAELKKLASNYAQVSQTLGRVQPKPVVSPVKDPGSTGGSGGGSGGPDLTGGGGSGGGTGGTGGPDLSSLGGGGGGGTGGTGAPDLSSLGGGGGGGTGGSPAPFTGGAGLPDLATTGGGGTGDLGGTGAISPFPGGAGTGDLGTGGGGAGLPNLAVPGAGAGGTGGAADPFTGGTATPDLPAGIGSGTGSGTGTTIDPFPGGTGTGTGLTDPALGTGGNLGAGSALPLPGFGSVAAPSTGTSGSSTSGQNLAEPVTAWNGGAQTPELATGGTGSIGVPDLGNAGAGLGDGAALPSDLVGGTPGLGSPASMPSSNLVSAPGLPDTSAAGAAGVGAGMPMMPMAPGMGAGAGGQGTAGAERPDASGLLGGEVKPWAGGEGVGALPEADPVAGAAAGGPGLSGLDAGRSLDPAASLAASPQLAAEPTAGAGEGAGAGAGMPMMPMMPATGAAGAGSAGGAGGERPDSSGLLEEATAPWTGEDADGAQEGAVPVAGAPSGGSALSGLPATASAGFVPVLPLPAAPTARTGRTGSDGAPAGGGNTEGEVTASSALLGGSAAVWSPGAEETATAPAEATAASPESAHEGAPAGDRGAPAQALSGTPTGVPGPGSPHARVAPREVSAAQSLADWQAETAPSAEPAVAAPLPEPPDDRVPVLAESVDTDDATTWDVAAAGFGTLMLAFAGQGAADGEHPQSTSRYAVAEPAVWEAEGGSAVRMAERTVDPGSASSADPELTTWRPAARPTAAAGAGVGAGAASGIAPDEEIRCGAGAGEVPDEPEPEGTGSAADDEQEDDEGGDEGALGLLTQDVSTWGTRPVVPDSIG